VSRRRHPIERRRGRHKKLRSPETMRWRQEQLLPRKRVWLDDDTYTKLARLRESL
jgi:hypothetical protein